jgi:hypothetical protein
VQRVTNYHSDTKKICKASGMFKKFEETLSSTVSDGGLSLCHSQSFGTTVSWSIYRFERRSL